MFYIPRAKLVEKLVAKSRSSEFEKLDERKRAKVLAELSYYGLAMDNIHETVAYKGTLFDEIFPCAATLFHCKDGFVVYVDGCRFQASEEADCIAFVRGYKLARKHRPTTKVLMVEAVPNQYTICLSRRGLIKMELATFSTIREVQAFKFGFDSWDEEKQRGK